MDFQRELESLINKHSMENGSNTPDFILAQYLLDCLTAYDKAVWRREVWFGREKKPGRNGEENKRQSLTEL